jgi:hypothetical protein
VVPLFRRQIRLKTLVRTGFWDQLTGHCARLRRPMLYPLSYEGSSASLLDSSFSLE